MIDPKNNEARGEAGSDVPAGGQASKAAKKKTLDCSAHHINKLVREVQRAGLQLRSTSGDTQLVTLPKVLEYLGARGANTYELVALGYTRAAARLLELQATYEIVALRESVIGPDGLYHINVARYFLIGKRKCLPPAQEQLDPGVA